MPQPINAIPEGFHTVTPLIVLRDAAKAIDFYKRAFGAQQLFRKDRPDGKVMHATIKIGDSVIMLADECDPHPNHERDCTVSPTSINHTTVNLYLYVPDVDVVFNQAVKAGATAVMPVTDMFWGDRMGQLKDPFGHLWAVATQKEIVAPAQLDERAKKFMAAQAKGK